MEVKPYKPESPGWELVPDHMRGAMERYLSHGIPPGSFLEAVLCNNLSEAVSRADHINRHRLLDIVNFLQWHVPANCWGDVAEYASWCTSGGIEGQKASHNEVIIQTGNEDAGC